MPTKNIKPEIRERITISANELVAEGIDSPTNAQVRDRMGSGSLSDISPVMKAWRESRKAGVDYALDMPARLKKEVEISVSQLWGTASKLASEAVENFRQEVDNKIIESNTELNEALKDIQRLETRLVDLGKVLENKDQIIEKINGNLSKESSFNSQLKAEKIALNVQITDKDTQIKDIKEDLKKARKDNRRLQNELIDIARKTNEV